MKEGKNNERAKKLQRKVEKIEEGQKYEGRKVICEKEKKMLKKKEKIREKGKNTKG